MYKLNYVVSQWDGYQDKFLTWWCHAIASCCDRCVDAAIHGDHGLENSHFRNKVG